MARMVVAGIYAGWWKLGGFLFVGDTHVHHLNYGIFLLSLAGFLSLTAYGQGKRWITAVIYGVGLGLTFDEFGMWLKLDDDYYNRLSYDAVVAISALFLLLITFGAFQDRIKKARRALPQPISAGTVLFREGDPADVAYYLKQGRVRVVKEQPDGRRTLAEIGPGEFVGEMALFTDQPRSATAEAISDLEVRRLDKKNLMFTIERHPTMGQRLIRSLAGRLVAANEQSQAGADAPIDSTVAHLPIT